MVGGARLIEIVIVISNLNTRALERVEEVDIEIPEWVEYYED